MRNIRLIKDRDELRGTCYFEILPGEYKGQCWNEGSMFLSEEVFGYLEPIIEKHEPAFDHYAFIGIPRERWQAIISDFRVLMSELPTAKTTKDLREQVGFIFGGSEAHFAEHFEENKSALQKTLSEFVAWLEDLLKEYQIVSVLGL